MTIYEDYFKHTRTHLQEHGPKTIVLLQNGKFYEIFNLRRRADTGRPSAKLTKLHDPPHYPINGDQYSLINDVSQLCTLTVSARHQFENHDVLMAGIPTQQLDKYVEILIADGYTVPVYNQEYDGKNPPRNLACIYSAGTYCPTDDSLAATQLTNTVMCVWLDLNKRHDKIFLAVATVDSTTAKSTISEYTRDYHHQPTTYDDVERAVTIHQPNEIILIGNVPSQHLNDVVQFTGMKHSHTHIHSTALNDPLHDELAVRCSKQTYQLNIIKHFFPHVNQNNFMHDYLATPFATQAFCYLLNFFSTHNARLIQSIEPPVIDNHQQLVLANNCLEQLNIINPQMHSKSLLALLDKCITPIGRREFHLILQHPITDVDALNESYSITQHLLDHRPPSPTTSSAHTSASISASASLLASSYADTLRKLLSQVRDIERFNLKANVNRLTPKDFHILHKNIETCTHIYDYIRDDDVIVGLLDRKLADIANAREARPRSDRDRDHDHDPTRTLENIFDNLQSLKFFIQRFFDLDTCANQDKHCISENIFLPGNYPDLDQKHEMLLNADNKINAVHQYLNSLVAKSERKSADGSISTLVKKNVTEKTPMHLSLTQRRASMLKLEIERLRKTNPSGIVSIKYNDNYDNNDNRHDNDENNEDGNDKAKANASLQFNLSLFEYRPKTSTKPDSDLNLFHPELDVICRGLFDARETMHETLQTTFSSVTRQCIEEHQPHVNQLVRFIRHIDILQCKAHIAEKLNLQAPTIVPASQSFLIMEGLRHCLVEHTQTDELYVSNDISFGCFQGPYANPTSTSNSMSQGYLLYGTNAVGKTCLIKSIGMAVIMAQAGLFAPCSSMTYSPYDQIFTRIVNRDDIFKGMSTFAMEMSELRTILNMCGPKSLVLGDELCSGTENISAISIFVAGLEILTKAKSSYIFATHFHEMQHCPEINSLPQLGMKHMRVRYNAETGLLEYNRRLEDGCGEAMYGLEVCRSLSMPLAFLERAHVIRTNLPQSSTLTPPVLQQNPSRYSGKKLMGACQLCRANKATETHHIHPQKDADANGFITTAVGTFHKDHPANLMAMCEECHHKTHASRSGGTSPSTVWTKTDSDGGGDGGGDLAEAEPMPMPVTKRKSSSAAAAAGRKKSGGGR